MVIAKRDTATEVLSETRTRPTVAARIAAMAITACMAVTVVGCAGQASDISDGHASGIVDEATADAYTDDETIREMTIKYADELGLSATDEQIADYISEMRGLASDEEWAQMLEGRGLTEDEYNRIAQGAVLEDEALEYFADLAEVSKQDIHDYADRNADQLSRVAKVSRVVFHYDSASDADGSADAAAKAAADELYAKLQNGEVSFDEALSSYGEKGMNGTVGWNGFDSYDNDYAVKTSELAVGDVSQPFKTSYGYVILHVDDAYDGVESLEGELYSYVVDNIKHEKAQVAYMDWVSEKVGMN